MILLYAGPHDSVDITLADGERVECRRGMSVDVPDVDVPSRVAAGFTTGDAKKDLDLIGDHEAPDGATDDQKKAVAENHALALAARVDLIGEKPKKPAKATTEGTPE